jgi:hydroxyacylglutathione hydrolase
MSTPLPLSAADPGERIATAVELIPVLKDNYVFVIHNGSGAVVVDPAVERPVADWLRQRRLDLVAVLQTHHHCDHIGGSRGLLRHWPGAAVVAARHDRQRIPFQTISVEEGDVLALLGRRVEVLEVPGHTLTHLAYYLPPPDGPAGSGELFCGDTLFGAGCGRLFEGSPAQMHTSLQRLAALPGDTRLWCAHEYTEANLRWAVTEAPDQPAIARRLEEVRALRRLGRPSIPSSVAVERATNLFLRAGDGEELARLRRSKDSW